MELIPAPGQLEMFLQLALAMLLGMFLGAERSIAGKTAGMRTYALVALGACLFIVISVTVTGVYLPLVDFDPLRVAAAVVTGIGFLGAGLIILQENSLRGLTTAAGLWVAAGIGVAVGYQMYDIAVFTTFLTLIVFTFMWYIEEMIKSRVRPKA